MEAAEKRAVEKAAARVAKGAAKEAQKQAAKLEAVRAAGASGKKKKVARAREEVLVEDLEEEAGEAEVVAKKVKKSDKSSAGAYTRPLSCST